MPLTHNLLFPPSQNDAAFHVWHSNGLIFFSDLFKDGTFFHLKFLKKTIICQKHFFRYLQTRSFARKHCPFPALSEKSLLDIILDWNPETRGTVSRIYKTIQTNSLPSLEKTKLAWEQDLNVEFTGEVWEHSLHCFHTTSLCLRHCLIQFKVLHRLHYRERQSKLYPNVDSTCIRCHLNSATAGHMFWECPSLTTFWGHIFEAISYICGKSIEPNPITAIFEFPMRV